MDKNENDQRVSRMFGEIVKLIPERSKIKTDLLYFKYAPILVMLFRWYGISQFYDNKMEITLWYEENEEPIWFFYFITYILYPISLWKGQVLHRLCVEWRIPIFYIAGVNVILGMSYTYLNEKSENKCLVIKLPGTVDDDSLPKLK